MNRGNLVALLLVAGLGAFFYMHDVKGGKERKAKETQEKRYFPELEKKDVTSLKIEKLGAPSFVHEMSKENGIWVLQGKEPVVLRTASTGQSVKALVELQKAEDAGDATSKPEDFGLDKPSYKLTLKDRKGQDHSLLLGAKTPDDSGYYVTPGPGKPITSIATSLTDLLDPATDNQREMSPLVFEPSTANKIVLESAGGPPIEVALSKPREDSGTDDDSDDGMEIQDLGEEWKVVRPEAAAADGAKIRDLLFNWRSVKVGRFMKADEKVAFEPSTVKLTVYVDRQSKPFVLDVGPGVPGKPGLYYARRTPPNEQMVLEIKDFKLLEPKLANVLQRHLYVFQPEEATRLEATIDKLKIEGSKSQDSWKVTAPKVAKDKEEAQKTAASDLVWELKNLEWSSKPDAKSVGEWKERAALEAWGEDKKSLAKVSLGQPGPNGQGAYVKDGAGVVYLVEKDPYQRWVDIKLRLEGKGPAVTPTPKPAPFVLPGQ
ncbi:MAG: DUF4340 domain-containing protein [Candidatus Eremiobacteraeota bacterium]|nr:DUF4340 domain-containing protein [Candidatus Eremiobacteraeota bacterium]MCW5871724.1 DUF4340 domain-containing protein [Candidatus Eremiobacteraeota bacterium]